MATNPNLLVMPIAENGNKNALPETQGTAGQMSQSTGFPPETSLPLGAGGVAPSREDFNGAFNLLGGVAFYAQKGWQFQWDATQDYYAGCIVRDTNDGLLYECLNDVSAGGSAPSADPVNWQPFASGGGLYLRESSKAYAVGDIAYNENLPSYMHLLCTTGGTTGATEPDFTGAQIGGTISDGTVVWTYAAFADRSHTVINSYYDDTTGDWYRVYADGWVEQGGVADRPTKAVTINLLKPYAYSTYTVLAMLTTTSADLASNYYGMPTGGLTTTTFDVRTEETVQTYRKISWMACGMGASA